MKTPIDLKDEEALRLFLENISSPGGFRTLVFGKTGSSGGMSSLISSKLIQDIIRASVKEFDDSMQKTINTFNSNFEDINSFNLATRIDTLNKINGIKEDITDISSDIAEAHTSILSNTSSIITTNSNLDTTNSNLDTTNSNLNALKEDVAINYATTTVVNSTFATKEAVGALYSVSVDANGHVAGYQAVATGEQSIFNIYAEKFTVSSSTTGEGYSPFQIDTTNHKINMTSDVAIDGHLLVSGTVTAAKVAANAITADKIAANAITADKIAANAITANDITTGTLTADVIKSNSITYSRIYNGSINVAGSQETFASDTYDNRGGSSTLIVLNTLVPGDALKTIRLYRNGNQIYQSANNLDWSYTLSIVDIPGHNTYTIKMDGYNTGNANIDYHISFIYFKK